MTEYTDELPAEVMEAMKDPGYRAAIADVSARYTLIDRLVVRRKDLGLTQQQVAEIMGVGQSTVSDFESSAADPRLSTFQRYARAVNTYCHVTLWPMVHVIEVRGAELMETLQSEVDRLGITDAVMTLIGGVDEFTVSTMDPDTKEDLLTAYGVPGELTGTGEVDNGTVHVHAVLGIRRDYEAHAVAGHLHSADVRTHFVRAYVQPC